MGRGRLSSRIAGLCAECAAAWGARVETTLYASGPRERVHPVGFVDAMAVAEMSLAEGLAGRKAALGAALDERFPRRRDLVLAGELSTSSARTRSWMRVPGWRWTPARGSTCSWLRGGRGWIRPG